MSHILPAPTTVAVRFIALYDHGFSFPVRRIIVGHGYMEKGVAHNHLMEMYSVPAHLRKDEPVDTYAGYLYVEFDRIRIFLGGSNSLEIQADRKKDQKLLEDIKNLPRLTKAILTIYPKVASGDIPHAMLAQW